MLSSGPGYSVVRSGQPRVLVVRDGRKLLKNTTMDKPMTEAMDMPMTETMDKPMTEAMDMPMTEAMDMPMTEAMDMPMMDMMPSEEIMLTIDTVMIFTTMALVGFYMLRRHQIHLASAGLGILLLLLGFVITASLYTYDLVTMVVLPSLMGEMKAMNEMMRLHLSYAWYIQMTAGIFIVSGLVLSIMGFARQVKSIETAKEEAEEARPRRARRWKNADRAIRFERPRGVGKEYFDRRKSAHRDNGHGTFCRVPLSNHDGKPRRLNRA